MSLPDLITRNEASTQGQVQDAPEPALQQRVSCGCRGRSRGGWFWKWLFQFFRLCCHSAAESCASDGLPTHQQSAASNGPCLAAINFGHTESCWFFYFVSIKIDMVVLLWNCSLLIDTVRGKDLLCLQVIFSYCSLSFPLTSFSSHLFPPLFPLPSMCFLSAAAFIWAQTLLRPWCCTCVRRVGLAEVQLGAALQDRGVHLHEKFRAFPKSPCHPLPFCLNSDMWWQKGVTEAVSLSPADVWTPQRVSVHLLSLPWRSEGFVDSTPQSWAQASAGWAWRKACRQEVMPFTS